MSLLLRRRALMGAAPRSIDAEGNPLTFETNRRLPLKKCQVGFLPVQSGSGDPSPENVRPITGWTGCNVVRCGKNLFDPSSSETIDTQGDGSLIRYGHSFPSGRYTIINQTGETLYYRTPKANMSDRGRTASISNNSTASVTVGSDYLLWVYMTTYNQTKFESIGVNAGNDTELHTYVGNTYPVQFPAMGKNLFDGQWEQGNIQIGTPQPSTTAMRSGYINVEPSTSYYGYTARSSNVFVFEYTEDGTYANKSNNIASIHVFTTGSTTKKIRIVDRNSGTETVNTGINYPSTETAYEPYTNTVYGGYVDLVTGEVWATWVSISAWGFSINSLSYIGDTSTRGVINIRNISLIKTPGDAETTKCNVAKYDNTIIQDTGTQIYSMLNNSIGIEANIRVLNSLTGITSSDTPNSAEIRMRAYLQHNPVQYTFKIATPILVTTLTPAEIRTLIGTNNILSDANDDINITYQKG